jgi:hypothetical protein
MATITDEMMLQRLALTRPYAIVILKPGPNFLAPGRDKIIWEHGRRNMSLSQDGPLAVVCPVRDDPELSGIGVFDASPEETRQIMEGDPAILAGVLTFSVHAARGFPGAALPA